MTMEVPQTWDDARLKKDRLARVQAEMKELGLGALYLNDSVYQRYVTGIKMPGGGVFVPVEGEPVAFVRARDAGYVAMQFPNVRPPLYNRSDVRDGLDEGGAKRFGQGIAALMSEHGVGGAPIGVDEMGASAILAVANTGIRVTEADPAIQRAWTVKTQDEVEIYKTIGQQYTHAVTRFRDSLRPGISENDLAGIVVNAWYEAGGEDIAQLNVCAGEHMNPWRRWPTQREVRDGEFVGIDLHGRGIHGLRGDGSRTFFVGDRPSAEQRDLYRQAYDYLQAATSEFRAGRPFDDVVASAKPKVPEKYQQQQFNLNVGHGDGMGSSGYPHLDPRKKSQGSDHLRVNQVISVECFWGEVGSPTAVKLEEMVLVSEGEPQRLSAVPFDDRFLR